MKTLLDRCRHHNITISRKMLDIGSKTTFVGHDISSERVKSDPEKLKAIKVFPRTTNVTEIRLFIGRSGLSAWKYQFCTITEVKQRWARLVLEWVTVQVLPECCC